ncbi:MAG TPA: histidine triad nucleotide-binding protein [Oscillatoriaceae cyanobacterium]
MPNCLFCRIANGEIPADKVLETPDVVVFRDINPQAPTHVLAIPRRHVPAFSALGPDDGALLGKLAEALNRVATQEGLSDGYRVVCNNGPRAGQSVDHLHLHLLGGRDLNWPPG